MKISSRFRRDGRIFAEKKAFYIKCLAKDIILSSFLGGNPSKF